MTSNKFVKFISNKWFIHTIGLLVIAGLIWFVGPIIAISDHYVLESISSRLLAIILVILIWAGFQLVKYLIAKKNDAKFVENLTLRSAKKDEVSAIQSRFDDAILTLKSGRNKKESLLLNSLPWYIIIGPPGSGKTTALMNSGLEFPLKDKLGADAVKGIGGTRHCDWWFTNEAVLIDTAGRFTTQDSDSEVDKTAWQSFMSMLKKYRKQRPINGVIVTMSLSDMLTLSEDERSYYAKTIRKRIDELSSQLGIKFPVYFMFTKCDLVNGFTPFFNCLTAKQREQVWGETFKLTENGESAIDINDYDLHFDELLNRLNSQLLLHLRQQNDPAKKADIVSFPAQMESMKISIHQFLVTIFAENKFQDSALLRGVYFTSGTQQGSPFDSLLGSIATEMGFSQDDDVNFSGRGKSFFISDLLTKVIFPESDIAGVNRKQQKWIKRVQVASVSLAAIAIIGLSSIWYVSYQENIQRIKSVEDSAERQENLILARQNLDASFESILNELNEARASLDIFNPKTFLDNFGLNQKKSFDTHSHAVYLAVLESRLLPLLGNRLENVMIEILRSGNKADLYSFLKAYLMYAGQHINANAEFESEWLKALAVADWQNSFAGRPEIVDSLSNHLDYLFSNSFAYIEPNERLVSAARNALISMPLEDQVYASIKDTLITENKNDLFFGSMAGLEGLDVFRSRDGNSLNDIYVPGMFTKKGFIESFLIKTSDISAEYLRNTWIMGEQNKRGNTPSSQVLQSKVYALYYRDYINTWNGLIRNITLAKLSDRQQGFSLLRTLAEENGPVEALIRSISTQTNLTALLDSAGAIKGAGEVAGAVSAQAQRVLSKANRVSRTAGDSSLMDLPGQAVTRKFSAFHKLTSSERGDPKVSQIGINISQYYEFIDQSLNDSFSETPAFDIAVARINNENRSQFSRLTSKSSSNPSDVNNWLNQISTLGWELVIRQAKTEIDRVWSRQVYSLYDQALSGRYPFNSRANSEIELADFASFFSPNGTFDSFVQMYISPFVDLQATTWNSKSYGGTSITFSTGTLAKLQRGRQITQYFFEKNSALPSLSFSLLPISLDANVAKFEMKLGAQSVDYAHGPRRYTNLNWPVAANDEATKIEFIQVDGKVRTKSELGPWALFRLLDNQSIETTGRNSIYHINITLDGLSIKYEMRANSEFNPIGARILQSLSLPEEL